jgi:FixJ family two-component response regulator
MPRILLVDDDDAVRRSLQLLLRAHGFDVRAYASPIGLSRQQEALQSACLVADLVMPQQDALALLAELRMAGWTAPAILISGYLTDEWEGHARKAGFDRVLPKPIMDEDLTKAIVELLQPTPG